eukprot:COSAG01_NODE_17_length_39991_cov_30.596160_16_plen_73_part_00
MLESDAEGLPPGLEWLPSAMQQLEGTSGLPLVGQCFHVSTRQLCSQRLLIRRMQGNKGMKGLHFVLCGRKWW